MGAGPPRAAPAVVVEERLLRTAAAERRELVAGLLATPRQIAPKHFYDPRGLALFEAITALPEYYPTRTERAILAHAAGEIAARTGAGQLVELGAGSAAKTRLLLDALTGRGALRQYVPVDVDAGALRRLGEELARAYPGLSVHAIAGDFLGALAPLPPPPELRPRLVLFLGGTIGNLRPADEAPAFLARLRGALGPGDRLLLGVDLVKDVPTLERAYDDTAGVTAEFNRNVLRVVNRLLDADFDPGRFRHRAFYDPANDWIEMRLVAEAAQTVTLGATGDRLRIAAGEEIHTEISAKYTRDRAEALVAGGGFVAERWLTDERGWFGLLLARAA